jgi:hypothetical protein
MVEHLAEKYRNKKTGHKKWWIAWLKTLKIQD